MATIKKYNGSTWENAVVRKYGTASEIITPPTTIYTDGTAISTYAIKGNTVQSGTPTPSNPVPVVGVGELETIGDHTGEYKIPISTAQGSAVNYLGSVQTTRQIKKLVLTGGADETWNNAGDGTMYRSDISDYLKEAIVTSVCTHYPCNANVPSSTAAQYGVSFITSSSYNRLYIKDTSYSTATDFKNWLATEYVNGTPVTIWYVLASETTGIVNEPLMKIGDYSDTLSNATAIPTTEGANSISVDTTVQPSEFTATWTGWHDSSVKEYDGTNWQ